VIEISTDDKDLPVAKVSYSILFGRDKGTAQRAGGIEAGQTGWSDMVRRVAIFLAVGILDGVSIINADQIILNDWKCN